MPSLGYVLAFLSACLIIAGGIVFCVYTRQSFLENFRQQLRDEKSAGKLPAELEDADLDTITPDGFDIAMSSQEMFKLNLAGLLSRFWFVWVLIVFGACFGVAFLLRRTPSPP